MVVAWSTSTPSGEQYHMIRDVCSDVQHPRRICVLRGVRGGLCKWALHLAPHHRTAAPTDHQWEPGYYAHDNFTQSDNLPESEWSAEPPVEIFWKSPVDHEEEY